MILMDIIVALFLITLTISLTGCNIFMAVMFWAAFGGRKKHASKDKSHKNQRDDKSNGLSA